MLRMFLKAIAVFLLIGAILVLAGLVLVKPFLFQADLDLDKCSCGIHFFKVLVQIHYPILPRSPNI